jgi:hypothetical protein
MLKQFQEFSEFGLNTEEFERKKKSNFLNTTSDYVFSSPCVLKLVLLNGFLNESKIYMDTTVS